MLELDVLATVAAAPVEALQGKTVVAIDVLRATTTITAALAAGCREVLPMLEPAAALAYRQRDGGVLLGGERGGLKIPGFDLGNSPLEFTPAAVAGRRIAFTTTNGTRAIHRAAAGELVLLAALVNAPAVARAVAAAGRDATFLCAGTQDRFSLEDFLAAGAIVDALPATDRCALRDGARAALAAYRFYRGDLKRGMYDSHHGQRLLELGLGADLDYCARLGLHAVVPVYRGGAVRQLE